MEQVPHRKEFEDLLNKAHEEALVDNIKINTEPGIVEISAMVQSEKFEANNAMEVDYNSIDPKNVKLFLLPEMVGKPVLEVIKYIDEKFSDRYYIPGSRYFDFIHNKNNMNKIPKILEGKRF